MGMRVRRAHHLPAVLEDLHVADPRVGEQLGVLLGPDVDHALDRVRRQVAQAEVVARRVAHDAARPILAVTFRNERGEVVREHERAVVVPVAHAAGALVARAEIAGRVLFRQPLGRHALDLSLPRSLRPLRRHQHPLAAQRVEAPVGMDGHGAIYTRAMRVGARYALVDGALVRGDVEIADGRIAAVGVGDGGHGIAAPGFVDVHIHGFAGVDFATADEVAYGRAAGALLETGVTSFRPSFITAPEDELVTSLAGVPRGLGAHLEGPFISAERLGMHPAAARRDPDTALLERLLAAGPVAHLTLAPELPGAPELIDILVARGITVACGHTNATAAEAYAAFDRGATHVTHLFNAMRPFTHRDPGIAGAALARDDVTVELILDGNHLSDEAVQLALRSAPGRIALVTDACAAARMGDGDWKMGSVAVFVRDGAARLADGTLAGSVLTMPDAIRDFVRIGARVEQALHAASRRSLAPGVAADVVVLDEDSLEPTATFLAGVRRGL